MQYLNLIKELKFLYLQSKFARHSKADYFNCRYFYSPTGSDGWLSCIFSKEDKI